MTHEFKEIITQALNDQKRGLKSVLATVVYLEGSSYRKPGVRMLISEDYKMTGAVSGGCVEAEVRRQSKSVFNNGKPKMMTYDGRFRLGCEGTLYILIEIFTVSKEFAAAFNATLESRRSFSIDSYFSKENEANGNFGSIIKLANGITYALNNHIDTKNLEKFSQTLNPSPRLIIIGAEHDAVKLCQMAALLGWEIDVITSMNDPKQLSDFPGAKTVVDSSPKLIDLNIDKQTFIVLMTHNYALDLKYLLRLSEERPSYIGVLGSVKRRQKLFNDMLEYKEDLDEVFFDIIHSPAGLNIGAITPEEIALSILSEILTVLRSTNPIFLRALNGNMHA